LAGQSRADFLSKMSIASKEARETKYWLRLLGDSGIISKTEIEPLLAESESIANILTSIVKTTKNSKLRIHNQKLTDPHDEKPSTAYCLKKVR